MARPALPARGDAPRRAQRRVRRPGVAGVGEHAREEEPEQHATGGLGVRALPRGGAEQDGEEQPVRARHPPRMLPGAAAPRPGHGAGAPRPPAPTTTPSPSSGAAAGPPGRRPRRPGPRRCRRRPRRPARRSPAPARSPAGPGTAPRARSGRRRTAARRRRPPGRGRGPAARRRAPRPRPRRRRGWRALSSRLFTARPRRSGAARTSAGSRLGRPGALRVVAPGAVERLGDDLVEAHVVRGRRSRPRRLARELHEVADEDAELLGLGLEVVEQRPAVGLRQLGGRRPQDLEVRPQARHGRAELVRRVGHEPALALERRRHAPLERASASSIALKRSAIGRPRRRR